MEDKRDIKEEGSLEKRHGIEFDDSDDTLIETANIWINEARPLHDEIKKKQDRNEKYYLGDQLDTKKMKDYQARIILNKVFQTLETLIPRAVENLPAPMASTPPTDDDVKEIEYRKYTTQVEETMLAIAEEQNLAQKLKEFLRFHQLYYLGCLKFGYEEGEGIWVENIRPQRLLLPPYEYVDYVIEFHEDTLQTLIRKYPKKETEIKKTFLDIHDRQRVSSNLLGTRMGYYEITTPEFKFWKIHNIVLKKEQNPHYDFKNEKQNHWRSPQLDYIFSDLFTLGNSKYSATTLIDQIIPLQDATNKRKRQISDNADRANGILVAFGEGGATKAEVAAMESARQRPDGIVFVEKGGPGSVTHFNGQQLPTFVYEDMVHTISEIDNLAGTHATTRGEKTPGEETFGGRQLLKESDQVRIGELTKMLERVAEQLYNAIAQMIRMHFKEEEYTVFLSADGAQKQLAISDKIIRDGLKIKVRQGTTLTKDKPTLSQEAIVLWGQKAIDPITLFERIGDPTPLKTAERLYQWLTKPEELFSRVEKDYAEANGEDEEAAILESVTQAGIENQALAKGQAVPPYENPTPQHLAVHQEFIEDPKFRTAPPEVRQNAANHIQAEVEMLKEGLATAKEENSMSAKELIDRGGKLA